MIENYARSVTASIASARRWLAAHRLGPGQVVVLCGMGQNGQRLMQLLLTAGVPVAYFDDTLDGDIDAPRLRTEELGPMHAMLVTPDARGEILNRLALLPLDALWQPADVYSDTSTSRS